jgi:hypothetical protein
LRAGIYIDDSDIRLCTRGDGDWELQQCRDLVCKPH